MMATTTSTKQISDSNLFFVTFRRHILNAELLNYFFGGGRDGSFSGDWRK